MTRSEPRIAEVTAMFASVRVYQVVPNKVAELNKNLNESFVPLLQKVPGFIAYYGVDAGDGEWSSVSIFETRAAAEESNRIAASYVTEHLKGFVQSGPTIVAGNVAVNGRT
jgi:hypothetical protein